MRLTALHAAGSVSCWVEPEEIRHAGSCDEFWARITKNPAPRLPVEERLPRWQGWAKMFALMTFVIGGCLLVREAVTLFLG